MKIQFNLRRDKKSKKTGLMPVSVVVYFNGETVRRSIPNVKVQDVLWDMSRQKILPSKKNEEENFSKEFNLKIDQIYSSLNNLWSKCLLQDINPTKIDVVNIIEGKVAVTSKIDEPALILSFDSFIDQNRSHRAERTITGYTTTRNLLKSFVDECKVDERLSKLDMVFYDKLRNYCFQEKGYMNNTFAKITNNIKAFMSWSEDRDLHQNTIYHKFKANEENIEVIYLTKDELFHLHEFEFNIDRLSRARDIYCFSCFTGLRYSDLANLKPSNVYDDQLKINVTKTRESDQVIPLSKYAKQILEKYKNTIQYPLPMISSQKLNEYIKEACEVAEINTLVTITRYSGKKKIEKTVPKYQLLTLHTGRKTFVTNSLVLGMNQMIIRGITGHKSDSAFRKYVKVADDVKTSEVSKFWDNIEK